MGTVKCLSSSYKINNYDKRPIRSKRKSINSVNDSISNIINNIVFNKLYKQ